MRFSRSELLPVDQVAWLTGRGRAEICRAVRMGVLPVVRRRGRVLVPMCAVAHFSTSSQVGGASL